MARERFHSKATKYLYDRFIRGDAKREAEYEEALRAAEIGREVYDLRKQANLTQRALAVRVGLSAAAIRRVEDADYPREPLAVLRRVQLSLQRP